MMDGSFGPDPFILDSIFSSAYSYPKPNLKLSGDLASNLDS